MEHDRAGEADSRAMGRHVAYVSSPSAIKHDPSYYNISGAESSKEYGIGVVLYGFPQPDQASNCNVS